MVSHPKKWEAKATSVTDEKNYFRPEIAERRAVVEAQSFWI
jgi:hypothetical protein